MSRFYDYQAKRKKQNNLALNTQQEKSLQGAKDLGSQ